MRSILLIILTVFAAGILNAQLRTNCLTINDWNVPFSCTPIFLMYTYDDTMVPSCADSITVCIGIPIPPRSADHTVLTPAYLLRDSGNDQHPYDTIDCDVRVDSIVGTITFYPKDPMPVMDDDLINNVEYLIQTNCEYWDTEETGTRQYRVIKQHTIRAYAEARSANDSMIIDDALVAPPQRSLIHLVFDGVNLYAPDTNGDLVFDKWTSSHEEIEFEPSRPVQHIGTECWPLRDTVIFTAWYTDEPTTVKESVGGGQGVFCTVTADRYSFTSRDQPITEIMVVDLLGRIERVVRPLPPSMQFDMSQPEIAGVHVVIVRTLQTTKTFTFTNLN
jgi:hypothetical protein